MRESLSLKNQVSKKFQLQTTKFRNWMKSRTHTRLENEDSFTEDATTMDRDNKGQARSGDSKTLIKLNDSLNETF